jgi:hypothetical protein
MNTEQKTMEAAENALIYESIAYWKHEHYREATDALLGEFKPVVLKAIVRFYEKMTAKPQAANENQE